MKIILISIIIAAVLFSIFQLYATMATNKSETQPYTVIRKEKEFEIRFYPSATMAIISSTARTYKELGSSGFTKLAGYIFGGNKDNKRIAMTSPVHMEIKDSSASMSFVMPSNYSKDNLPTPNNAEVIIHTTPDEYVAVITFGGFTSNDNINKHITLLGDALKAHNISYYGNFRYLGYNPPYQLFDRRNEVIISVNEEDI
jgi:SOUL heme-binding protein